MGLLELDWNSAVAFLEFSLDAAFLCMMLTAIAGMMDAVGLLPRYQAYIDARR